MKDKEFIRIVHGLVYEMGYNKEYKSHEAVITQLEYYIKASSLIDETLEILNKYRGGD